LTAYTLPTQLPAFEANLPELTYAFITLPGFLLQAAIIAEPRTMNSLATLLFVLQWSEPFLKNPHVARSHFGTWPILDPSMMPQPETSQSVFCTPPEIPPCSA
jgi:hypothetical protein